MKKGEQDNKTLYLSKNDYDKIKVYRRHDLIDINKKIVIKAETKFLHGKACEKLTV
ncbi:MAG: hypothetical protein IPK31_03605 [Chitinophagaceae bacterium]|nr:hypothetical protein [Chitinophagaceae bacterium]